MEKFDLSEMFSTLIYAGVGIAIFFFVLVLIEILTKYSVNKKIAQEGNVALAIVLASIIIALGLIISASIH